MRVLLTAHRFWPHVGGTEEVVEQLATRYAARGHDVTVATQREPDTPLEESRNGFAIRRFDLKQVGKFRFPPAEYRAFVQDARWDVVHLHGQRVWSTDYLYRHLGSVPAPVVFTAHGFYQYHVENFPLVNDWYYHVLLPRVLKKRTAAVTALTGNERNELVSWGVPSAKVRVIPDGFDIAEFTLPSASGSSTPDGVDAAEFDAPLPGGFREKHGVPEDAPLALYVGGFYRNKRVPWLIDALARSERKPHLVVIGQDRDPRRGQAYCAKLADRKGVPATFTGRVPREDVLAAYAAADVSVLASDFEGFCLFLLESMAAGVPFVSTPAGAAPDLARDGGGVLADEPAAFAREVDALLADDAQRRAVGERARKAARAYDWDAITERYLDLYAEVQRA